MDDDLLDRRAAKGLPWRYRWKLARLSTWRRGWLRGQGAELWVSTPYLEAKYAEWHPRLIPAVALPAVERDDSVRLFYHGSASHASEIRWLYPVIETVLRLEPRLTFEIIGGADVNRHYRRLPRTSVVHPMSWPAYQAFLTVPGRHIGLAPLLDEPFNRARACTKFFDITRAGAVGLYASAGVCGDTIEHGVNGWLAPLDVGTWVEAIRFLVQDAVLRQALLGYAREKLGAFSLTAHDMGAAQNGEPVLDSADARKRQ
ncbi:glycosyltransferase family 1 protein [Thiocystis violacea]|uniref:glycosyltransferase family 1 protein n=1 Tax=Thiocystis violacea TaxID=13725 RepID=UPI0019051096|nr:glycosyltransferase family 1 protein [Thiocystis violacea]